MDIKPPELFELIQDANEDDINSASKDIAEILRKRDLATYPALIGVMLKTVAQFMEAAPDAKEAVHTALISLDEDTIAKIDIEFCSPDELQKPDSEMLH